MGTVENGYIYWSISTVAEVSRDFWISFFALSLMSKLTASTETGCNRQLQYSR